MGQKVAKTGKMENLTEYPTQYVIGGNIFFVDYPGFETDDYSYSDFEKYFCWTAYDLVIVVIGNKLCATKINKCILSAMNATMCKNVIFVCTHLDSVDDVAKDKEDYCIMINKKMSEALRTVLKTEYSKKTKITESKKLQKYADEEMKKYPDITSRTENQNVFFVNVRNPEQARDDINGFGILKQYVEEYCSSQKILDIRRERNTEIVEEIQAEYTRRFGDYASRVRYYQFFWATASIGVKVALPIAGACAGLSLVPGLITYGGAVVVFNAFAKKRGRAYGEQFGREICIDKLSSELETSKKLADYVKEWFNGEITSSGIKGVYDAVTKLGVKAFVSGELPLLGLAMSSLFVGFEEYCMYSQIGSQRNMTKTELDKIFSIREKIREKLEKEKKYAYELFRYVDDSSSIKNTFLMNLLQYSSDAKVYMKAIGEIVEMIDPLDPTQKNSSDRTLLMFAVKNKNLLYGLLQTNIVGGCYWQSPGIYFDHLKMVDKLGKTAFIYAAKEGTVNSIWYILTCLQLIQQQMRCSEKEIVEKMDEIIKMQDMHGMNALMHSIKKKNIDIALYLLGEDIRHAIIEEIENNVDINLCKANLDQKRSQELGRTGYYILPKDEVDKYLHREIVSVVKNGVKRVQYIIGDDIKKDDINEYDIERYLQNSSETEQCLYNSVMDIVVTEVKKWVRARQIGWLTDEIIKDYLLANDETGSEIELKFSFTTEVQEILGKAKESLIAKHKRLDLVRERLGSTKAYVQEQLVIRQKSVNIAKEYITYPAIESYLLEKEGNDIISLVIAIIESVQRTIQRHLNPEAIQNYINVAREEDGHTPIIDAVTETNSVRLVNALIKKGARIDYVDAQEMNVLIHSIRKKNIDMAFYLLGEKIEVLIAEEVKTNIAMAHYKRCLDKAKVAGIVSFLRDEIDEEMKKVASTEVVKTEITKNIAGLAIALECLLNSPEDPLKYLEKLRSDMDKPDTDDKPKGSEKNEYLTKALGILNTKLDELNREIEESKIITEKYIDEYLDGRIKNAETSEEKGAVLAVQTYLLKSSELKTYLKSSRENEKEQVRNIIDLMISIAHDGLLVLNNYLKPQITSQYLNVVDNTYKKTPIIYAVTETDSIELVSMLVSKTEDKQKYIDLQDNAGKTALMYAVEKGNVEMVGLLVSNGADVNIQDKENNIAIMYVGRGYSDRLKINEISKILFSAGTDLTIFDPIADFDVIGDYIVVEELIFNTVVKPKSEEIKIPFGELMRNYIVDSITRSIEESKVSSTGDTNFKHIEQLMSKQNEQIAVPLIFKLISLEKINILKMLKEQNIIERFLDCYSSSTKDTLLTAAIKSKRLDMVRLFLETKLDFTKEKDAVMLAKETGNQQIYDYVLSACLNARLKEEIVGQDEAINIICSTISAYISERQNDTTAQRIPFGRFLFTGPVSVGKTRLSNQIAIELGIPVNKFDMSLLNQEGFELRKFGEYCREIVNTVLKNPGCVLIFDKCEEVKKISIWNSFLEMFLPILTTGRIILDDGKTVQFRHAMVIFEHNSKEPDEVQKRFGYSLLKNLQVVNFNSLTWESRLAIAGKTLSELKDRLYRRAERITLTIGEGCEEWIATKCHDSDGTAAVIQKIVSDMESKCISHMVGMLMRVSFNIQGDKFIITLTDSRGETSYTYKDGILEYLQTTDIIQLHEKERAEQAQIKEDIIKDVLKNIPILYGQKRTKLYRALEGLVKEEFANSDGQSILHIVVQIEPKLGEDLITYLIGKGANLHVEDKNGMTPIALAIKLNKKQFVRILIEAQNKKHISRQSVIPESWKKIEKSKTKIEDKWLRDDQVKRLLENKNLQDTHISPAVDIFKSPEVLAQFIRENYIQQLQDGGISKYTVISINFRNAHWSTLVIVQNEERRSSPSVYFFDSMGAEVKKTNLIREMICMTGVYTNVDRFNDISQSLQQDGHTCGTWMVESATTIITNLEKGNNNREDILKQLGELQNTIQNLHEINLKYLGQLDKETKSKTGIGMTM